MSAWLRRIERETISCHKSRPSKYGSMSCARPSGDQWDFEAAPAFQLTVRGLPCPFCRYTLSGRDEKTLMKLLVHAETDVVVGAHM